MTVTRVADGVYRVDDGRRRWTVAIAGPPDDRWIWVDGQVWTLESPAAGGPRKRRGAGGSDLSAPMPATVVRILASPGAAVRRGDTLIVLEAMKMELPVKAPHDGVIANVRCQAGELVQPGEPLVEFEAEK
jgi:biotin carboxyl carrier protein